MKKEKFILTVLMLMTSVMCVGFVNTSRDWQKSDRGIFASEVTALTVHPSNHSIVFAASRECIYKSIDQGKNYTPAFTLSGSDGKVNFLYSAPEESDSVFAAADSGLFISRDMGRRWQKIFSEANNEKRKCLSVLVEGGMIYLATKDGLFKKEYQSGTWQKIKGVLGSTAVYFLTKDKNYIYAATDSGILSIDKATEEIKKIYSLVSHEVNGATDQLETPLSTNGEESRQIKFLTVGQDKTFLYVATQKGILRSHDNGKSWEELKSGGLPFEEITSLVELGESDIVISTFKGIFHYDGQKWGAVYKGLETNKVNYLYWDGRENLYAATGRGIFILPIRQSRLSAGGVEGSQGSVEGLTGMAMPSLGNRKGLKQEPTINEVHHLAIEYAEVSPRKIQQWRRQASSKAWLPTLSAGLDRTSTDFYHWDTGPNPDELRKGKDLVEWDVSLSWDLGDLIWNGDQTSIDSSSKLMVELREDILDQVTRLYFERRRLQNESLTSEGLSAKDIADKELRIAELTALIDGFTGGEFSRRINEKK